MSATDRAQYTSIPVTLSSVEARRSWAPVAGAVRWGRFFANVWALLGFTLMVLGAAIVLFALVTGTGRPVRSVLGLMLLGLGLGVGGLVGVTTAICLRLFVGNVLLLDQINDRQRLAERRRAGGD
jgi:hypothetical protein